MLDQMMYVSLPTRRLRHFALTSFLNLVARMVDVVRMVHRGFEVLEAGHLLRPSCLTARSCFDRECVAGKE